MPSNSMSTASKRAIAIVCSGAALLTLFLAMAGPLDWRPLLLAVGGFSLIVATVVVTIHLVEANDTKHAKANLARIARVEAEESGRQMKQGLVG